MAIQIRRFDASMFQATEFATAEDKAWFGNQLLAFVEAGFPESKFTKALYDRLNATFGFIAHFNRDGFWDTYFTNIVDKIEFLKHIIDHPCYGSPVYTFSDVEQAIRGALIESGVLERYEAQNHAEIEHAERNVLARLKAKYECDDSPAVTSGGIVFQTDFLSAPVAPAVRGAPAVQATLF